MATKDVTICPTCNGCGRVRVHSAPSAPGVDTTNSYVPAFPDLDLPALVEAWTATRYSSDAQAVVHYRALELAGAQYLAAQKQYHG